MPPSLCPGCVHVRLVTGRRAQTYLLCQNETIADKYPPQPVVSCPGYTPRPAAAPQGRQVVIESAELGSLLRAHSFLKVERPPALWAVEAELEPFVRLLGEMISAGLVRNGGVLAEITLNIANVTVEPMDDSSVPTGDFVALSIAGGGDWHPETRWPDTAARPFVNTDLEAAAGAAGAAYGYTRVLARDRGSVTVFFHRAREEEPSCTR